MAEEMRIVLRNYGKIDPLKIEDYIAVGGYESARKVLLKMTKDIKNKYSDFIAIFFNMSHFFTKRLHEGNIYFDII